MHYNPAYAHHLRVVSDVLLGALSLLSPMPLSTLIGLKKDDVDSCDMILLFYWLESAVTFFVDHGQICRSIVGMKIFGAYTKKNSQEHGCCAHFIFCAHFMRAVA